MSAREGLEVRLIRDAGLSAHWAKRQIDNFAHELAEKQRQKLIDDGYDGPCACGGCSWCLAQDYIGLIDPEKET